MRWSSLESLRLLDDETTLRRPSQLDLFFGISVCLSVTQPKSSSRWFKKGTDKRCRYSAESCGFRNRSRHGRSMESGPENCGT